MRGRGIGGKKGGLFVILFDSSALFGREDVSSRFDLMSSEGLENCIAERKSMPIITEEDGKSFWW